MPTRVKICGITRLEDAQLAVELGAAALGFNFYPRSPRYVAPTGARAMVEQLTPFVTPVGVFADETDGEHVAETARRAAVRVVQLHGPKFPAKVDFLKDFFIIRAVGVSKNTGPLELAGLAAKAWLLDSFDADLPGGTGKAFDWSLAREAKRFGTIILAGGLTPENVGRAIREVRPYAVDVASGVESAPGIKDPAKMRAFFSAVTAADRELSQ